MANGRKVATKSADLRDFITRLDVDVVGIVNLSEWKETELEKTALKLLPQTHSVVVFAMEIFPEFLDLTSPKTIMGAPPMNDLIASHIDFLNSRLVRAGYDLTRTLHHLGLKALPLPGRGCPVDERFLKPVFSFKQAAHAAGLGKIGWNSLLITPAFGPRVRLAACLTEAELESTTPVDMTLKCESCGICVKRCSSGALSQPQNSATYSMNKFACKSYRSPSGGCFECMRSCPVGR